MSIKIMADNNEVINVSQDAALYNVLAAGNDFIIDGIGNEMVFNYNAASLSATLASGECLICGRHVTITGTESITLGASSNGYIVLRYDLTQTGSNICKLMAVTSTRSDNLNNNGTIHDLVIGQYSTNAAGVSSFTDQRKVMSQINTVDIAEAESAIKDGGGNVITSTYKTVNSLKSKGGANQPVYFDANGNAVACTAYASASVNYATSAGSATKATQDASGNVITSTYKTINSLKSKGSSTVPIYFDANGNAQNVSLAAYKTVDSLKSKGNATTPVYFDGNGNAVACTAYGSASVASAGKLTTARTISLTGAVTGSVSFDGSGNVSIATSIGTIPTILSGTGEPSTSAGKNGDIYILYR